MAGMKAEINQILVKRWDIKSFTT